MKVIVIYRPNSERSRLMDEFIADFQRRNPTQKLEVIDMDSRDGIAMAAVYDIMEFPAVLVVQTDGSLQKHWTGETMPLIDEVAGYARG